MEQTLPQSVLARWDMKKKCLTSVALIAHVGSSLARRKLGRRERTALDAKVYSCQMILARN